MCYFLFMRELLGIWIHIVPVNSLTIPVKDMVFFFFELIHQNDAFMEKEDDEIRFRGRKSVWS